MNIFFLSFDSILRKNIQSICKINFRCDAAFDQTDRLVAVMIRSGYGSFIVIGLVRSLRFEAFAKIFENCLRIGYIRFDRLFY